MPARHKQQRSKKTVKKQQEDAAMDLSLDEDPVPASKLPTDHVAQDPRHGDATSELVRHLRRPYKEAVLLAVGGRNTYRGPVGPKEGISGS